MDQGIIQNLKVHYRKRLLRRRIAAIDSGENFTFNLLDAVFLLRQAWNEVTESTISNCFRKAGFLFNAMVTFKKSFKLILMIFRPKFQMKNLKMRI